MSNTNLNIDAVFMEQYKELTDEELENISGGSVVIAGTTYSSYAAFYNKYGDLWNALTGE